MYGLRGEKPIRPTVFSWTIGGPSPSIFRGLLFYVIDDQHGHWTLLLLQFQPELFADGIEE